MNPTMQQAIMQQMQNGQVMGEQMPQATSPWMGMTGMPQDQGPMDGQMLANNFPPAPAAQQQVADYFKPKMKPSPMPKPNAAPYKGLTPTMVDQLQKMQNR